MREIYCRRGKELLTNATKSKTNGRICEFHLRQEKTEQIREKRRAAGSVARKERLIDDLGQECSSCDIYKIWSDFYDDKNNPKPGKRATCAECVLEKQTIRLLKKNFNITLAQYNYMLEQQNGLCFLCEEVESKSSFNSEKSDRLAVDHCHTCTEEHTPENGCIQCIRGLLCSSCNRMIGCAENKPKPKLVILFSDYLDRRPLL